MVDAKQVLTDLAIRVFCFVCSKIWILVSARKRRQNRFPIDL